jgi:hypothetical protein
LTCTSIVPPVAPLAVLPEVLLPAVAPDALLDAPAEAAPDAPFVEALLAGAAVPVSVDVEAPVLSLEAVGAAVVAS